MNREELFRAIQSKDSFLCVGLDSEWSKLPEHLKKLDKAEALLEFNKEIIRSTADLAVSYKINIAFYECLGPAGWELLDETLKFIPKGIFTIADAKRGDIGNTSRKYAETFFEYYDFDAVTVAPYMGRDSVEPFLGYAGKWVILLGLTSNPGSKDFQNLQTAEGMVYEQVIRKSAQWGNPDQLMYVVGATHPHQLGEIRKMVPEHFFLVPGVGAQGGDLEAVAKSGLNDRAGLLVNSSRGIIYAGHDEDFGSSAKEAAQTLQSQMARILQKD